MVASKLSKYLNLKDKNGVVVSSWAVVFQPGIAKCRHCDFSTVSFKSGKADLFKHSQTETHKKRTGTSKVETVRHQLNIQDAFAGSNEADRIEKAVIEKTSEFEISLVRSLSNHKIPPNFLNCLQTQLKKYCSDSDIISRMKISDTKGRYILRHGISPTYQDETLELLRQCDGFSVGFDESEVNKVSELEILVKVATKEDGVSLRHYRTLDLYSATANNIVIALLGQFDEDGVDYKKKLFSVMTDGCNTMQGWKGGVKKLLSDKVPQFIDMGSCNDHHLCNAMKHGVTKFDSDITQSLVNVYQDIGGAKGKGLKKKKEFEAVSDAIGLTAKPLKKFCATRFRGIRNCITPVLFDWEGIVNYYATVKKPTDRQLLLKAYFVDREMMSLLNMNFIQAAIRELIDAIDYFEQRSFLLHESRRKMENILRCQILKIHCETAVKEVNDDLETVKNRTGKVLLEVDLDDPATLLKKKRVFIGQKASLLIQSLGLNPNSPQLDKFFASVYTFHKTVASLLMKYFETGLKCTELEYMAAFSPRNRTAISTPFQIKYLTHKFSKIIENIEPQEGLDRVEEEIYTITTDDEILGISETHYEGFWQQVSQMKEGEADWIKYPILPRFAMVLATSFNSNSEAERGFSVQTDVHRDPKRNSMSQETFEAQMQVHYGVEGKHSKELCSQCIEHKAAGTTPPSHCHCCVAEIGPQMKENCKTAWKTEVMRQQMAKITPAEQKDASQKVEKSQQEATNRKLLFVRGLKTRSSFNVASLMTKVYPTEDELKARKKEESVKAKEKKTVTEKVQEKEKDVEKVQGKKKVGVEKVQEKKKVGVPVDKLNEKKKVASENVQKKKVAAENVVQEKKKVGKRKTDGTSNVPPTKKILVTSTFKQKEVPIKLS